jgi:hypothetical protein
MHGRGRDLHVYSWNDTPSVLKKIAKAEYPNLAIKGWAYMSMLRSNFTMWVVGLVQTTRYTE